MGERVSKHECIAGLLAEWHFQFVIDTWNSRQHQLAGVGESPDEVKDKYKQKMLNLLDSMDPGNQEYTDDGGETFKTAEDDMVPLLGPGGEGFIMVPREMMDEAQSKTVDMP